MEVLVLDIGKPGDTVQGQSVTLLPQSGDSSHQDESAPGCYSASFEHWKAGVWQGCNFLVLPHGVTHSPSAV